MAVYCANLQKEEVTIILKHHSYLNFVSRETLPLAIQESTTLVRYLLKISMTNLEGAKCSNVGWFYLQNSRCIFLDLVYDPSAEACISVLQRFISSRGAPKTFISDNGSAFISKDVQNFVSSKFIRWKFNTEAAPWTGGFFERMIKSVKRCLKKVLLYARLNYEELLTILKEIENIVNNRPLIYMYDNVNQEVLTPNKLLFGRKLM